MNLLAAHNLLWLGLALPLVAIYFLKVRPKRKLTTQFFLWDQALAPKRSSSLFRRLRDLLSLLIMLGVIASLGLAMARPVFEGQRSGDLLLVIDRSASMANLEGSSTRFERGIDIAESLIDSLGVDQSATLVAVDHQVDVVVYRSNNPKELLDGLRALEAVALPLREEGLSSIFDNGDFIADLQVVMIGDRKPTTFPSEGRFVSVGTEQPNLGITAFDVDWIPGEPGRIATFYELTRSASGPAQGYLWLQHEGKEIKAIPYNMGSGNSTSGESIIENGRTGSWSLGLEGEDALDWDDRVWAELPSPQPLRVDIRAGKFLQSCVKAFENTHPGMKIDRNSPEIVLARGQGLSHTGMPILVFAPSGNTEAWSFRSNKKVEVESVVVAQEDHPFLRFLDPESLPFNAVGDIVAPKRAVVVLEALNGTPILYTVQEKGRTVCVINAEPEELFISSSLPILVYSIAGHLSGREQRTLPYTRIESFDPSAFEWRSTDPENHRVLPGVVTRLEDGKRIALNLLSPQESGSSPLHLDAQLIAEEQHGSPFRWLLWFALVLLILEAVLYQKRKVG